eukprot:CAMPEP_0197652654 /NCGR_PEP_ID=MMETSP1338-20131121/34581_1 /TAXON_ID=43686 ORGANISM="Pelagodinium beii, Strain RCC1491" /NCGR_SAMPLE_ID=MMETSP1338 /ASSEMBLY_ACC=CAM_ASM_000754 /LENGTH=87 /DNA_ID=CAMNT_0043227573 /DNA_START=54 /DNA_END=313 /DNA_ORIENTATION=-
MAGGVGEAKAPDAEVVAIVNDLKASILEKAQASGYNGLLDKCEVAEVKTQVVAGMNFFVKLLVSDSEAMHVRIYKALPHTKKPPEVT